MNLAVVGALKGKVGKDGGGWCAGEAAAGHIVVATGLTARYGKGADSDVTLADQGAAVAFSEAHRGEPLETDRAHQLTTGGGKPGQGYPAARIGSQVRRLSPVECERLMSWPDGWTLPEGSSLADEPNYPARCQPDCPPPDGFRYAACGDGVVANAAEWIGRRLLRVAADA